jgi:hypothetical protein
LELSKIRKRKIKKNKIKKIKLYNSGGDMENI